MLHGCSNKQTYQGSTEKLKPERTSIIEEQTIKKVEATASFDEENVISCKMKVTLNGEKVGKN